MPAFLIPLAVAAAQMGYGAYQSQKAKKQLESLERPQYEIPEEVKQNLSMAERRVLEGLPEEQRKSYIENIQRGRNTAVSNLQDRRSSSITDVYQSEVDQYKGLFSADVAARRQNEQQVMQQNTIMGQFKDKQFEMNQMKPYRLAYNEAKSLQGAGIQNMMSGVNTAVGAGAMAQQSSMYKDYLGATGTPKTMAPIPMMESTFKQPVQTPYPETIQQGNYPTVDPNQGMYPTPGTPQNPYSFENTNPWLTPG